LPGVVAVVVGQLECLLAAAEVLVVTLKYTLRLLRHLTLIRLGLAALVARLMALVELAARQQLQVLLMAVEVQVAQVLLVTVVMLVLDLHLLAGV
jgi:hypothetical protein